MDLTLPPTAPQLGKYSRYRWDCSSFAIYTLVKTSEESLQKIASKLEEEEQLEEDSDGGLHLVQVAPNHNFEGRSLRDVLQAHILLLETEMQRVEPFSEYSHGHLDWFPTAFIVLTSDDTEGTSLLFVYADPYDKPNECPMDNFHFRVEDARDMLSSIGIGDLVFTDAKERYATGDTDT